MQSKATTVSDYLASMPADRRAHVSRIRVLVNANIDPAIQEGMLYGMITWSVPHSVFPPGYHVDPKTPLPFAALASQKNHMSLYLMTAYGEGSTGEAWIRTNWPKTAKKLDMGKSCIRFKRSEDLALDVVAEAIRRVPVQEHLSWYARVDPRNGVAGIPRVPARKAAAKKAAPKKPAPKKPAPKKPAPKKPAPKKAAPRKSAAKKK
jgi:hypothetical protein